MPSASQSPNKPKELIPPGNYLGRVYSVIHIGVVDGEWQGKPTQNDKIRIGFELPLETKVFKEGEEPKPLVISREFNLTMGTKSTLRPIVEGIIGAKLTDPEAFSFDMNDLIGYSCMVNVIHESFQGNEFAKIMNTAPVPKGMDVPEAVNETFVLDYNENWSQDKFDNLPNFIKEKMVSSKNYQNKFRDPDEEAFNGNEFDNHVPLTPIEDMEFKAKDEEDVGSVPF